MPPAATRVVKVTNDYKLLGTYAVKRTNGTLTLLVINKSSSSNLTAVINVGGYLPATNATAYSYGIPQDTAAQTGIGSMDIQTNSLGVAASFTNTFAPYSATVLVLNPVPPTVVIAPITTNIIYGNGVALTASATGNPPLSYQWYDNHTNIIAGATNSSLVFTSSVAASGNYTVIVNSFGKSATNLASVTIGKAALTVTANNTNRLYGAANPAFTGSVSGVTNGDNITASYSSGATSASPAGYYAIIPALADPGSRLSNYIVTTNNGILTVNKVGLTVAANNTNRLYGSTNPMFTATYNGFVNGDSITAVTGSPSLTTPATSASPVGSYPIIVTNGTLSAVSYYFGFTNGVLAVNPAALTVTANSTNKVYGTGLIFAGTEFGVAGLANSDLVASATLTSTGAVATAAVGNYPIIVTNAVGSGLTNYVIGYVAGNLTVIPATNQITGITLNGDGSVTLSFAGTAGSTWRVQTATDLTSSAWMDVWTNGTGTNGLWQFNDTNTADWPQRYYRTVNP